MHVSLLAAGLLLNDHPYRQLSGSHTFAASNRPPRRRQASVFSRLIASAKAHAQRRRLANDLYDLGDRLLADIGITREDIPAVVYGTHVRQPESAPIEYPAARQVSAHAGAAKAVANDNEAQIAA